MIIFTLLYDSAKIAQTSGWAKVFPSKCFVGVWSGRGEGKSYWVIEFHVDHRDQALRERLDATGGSEADYEADGGCKDDGACFSWGGGRRGHGR